MFPQTGSKLSNCARAEYGLAVHHSGRGCSYLYFMATALRVQQLNDDPGYLQLLIKEVLLGIGWLAAVNPLLQLLLLSVLFPVIAVG